MSNLAVVEQLRGRIRALEGGQTRVGLPVLPVFEGLLTLQTGGVYGVDSASVGMALAAGASQAGQWVGFAGWEDFGVEAAHQAGIDLTRTVLVPRPAGHWLEVTAALVDVLSIVVLRLPGGSRVDAKSASIIEARLRARSGVLVVHGAWPRCEATITTEAARWGGLSAGRGHLQERRVDLVVHRGDRGAGRASGRARAVAV